MIVQCPNCQAKFRLPDDKIGSGGAKVRCGKCRHVFPVSPPEPEPESVAGLTDFDFPDDMTAPPETAGAALAAPPKDVPAAAQSASKPSSVEPFDAPAEEPPEDDGPVRPGFSLSDVADIPLQAADRQMNVAGVSSSSAPLWWSSVGPGGRHPFPSSVARENGGHGSGRTAGGQRSGQAGIARIRSGRSRSCGSRSRQARCTGSRGDACGRDAGQARGRGQGQGDHAAKRPPVLRLQREGGPAFCH